jgi:hypothetical protein
MWIAASSIWSMCVALGCQVPELFPVDPVALVAGRAIAGDQAYTVVQAPYEYRFVSTENRDAFVADVARYEVQLGGACARMGPLSSRGDVNRYAIHDGRIYIFASDGCREGFLSAPEKLLERADPRPESTPESATEGAKRFARFVETLGGSARIDAIRSMRQTTEVLKDDQVERRTIWTVLFDADSTIRACEQTQFPTSDKEARLVLDHQEARSTWNGATEIYHPVRAEALSRKWSHHPLIIARARTRSDFVVVSAGETETTQDVIAWFGGAATRLRLDATSGELRSTEFIGRAANLTLAKVEVRWSEFRTTGGLRLPYGSAVAVDGAEPGAVRIAKEVVCDAPIETALFD